MQQRRTRGWRKAAPRAAALGAGGLLLALVAPATTAAAAPGGGGCQYRDNDTYDELLECVTVDGVLDHLEEFQKIADNSTDPVYPGTRAAGTDGYADSVDYVAGLLREAGYEVTLDPVQITFLPGALRQTAPVPAQYRTGVFTGSGSGTVEGTVIPVDLNLATGPDAVSTSGCQAADFAAHDWSGDADIALVQRGTCRYGTQAHYAAQAGAEAVVIMNQGNTPEREGLVVARATSVDPPLEGAPGSVTHRIPVVGASSADGIALSQPGSTAIIEVSPAETRTDYNVLAELPGENPDNVVMAGAHLDSVIPGPGINDNGSGSAALLETALMMAETEHENTLRFGWWAAEEQGLVGSRDYVTGLSQAERNRIALYMNYDMVGSPNHVFMVYDADQSTFPAPEGVPIPEGSTAIEDLYESYYTLIGQPYADTEFSGRSDYDPFIRNDIPSSGLFTGAEKKKTEEQAAIWGGTAGQQFDPCYHEACDTIQNLDRHALDVNSDLIAFAMLTFASSTESVNGVEGRDVPGDHADLPAPAGPQGTFTATGGGA
jgi:hypothetical protein